MAPNNPDPFDLDVRFLAADDTGGGGDVGMDRPRETRSSETCSGGCEAGGGDVGMDRPRETRSSETCSGGCEAGGDVGMDRMRETRMSETCDVC
jgi:hypothetical protein